jgi:cellulose synthase/poly-beta-1,6-N-acetylglucosamine synthase-like glycosyltransferase
MTWATLSNVVFFLYVFVFGMVCIYGLHRYQLVYLYYKHRRHKAKVTTRFERLPRVTIQLPMYNERYVARRIIELACQVDYPRELLQIQVLDDSTDDTKEIAREAAERMQAAGHDVVYLPRDNRGGFKAGALEEGLKTATGEFVCIFDADFLPPPEIIRETIHYFTDPRIGMVQSRWEHINRGHSLLTKTQAVLLDGHFVIEHGARNRSGRFMSFNGTAGIWRIECIRDAGGWQHDTLTEDLDLSYRAQLKGWKFVFDPEVSSAAELPPEMRGFKDQQYRWAKGGAQTCRKLLPRILRSRLPFKIKWEAFFHLTSCTVYLYMTTLILLLFPVIYAGAGKERGDPLVGTLVDFSLFIIATCSASTFYAASQRELFRTWAESVKYLPFLMSLGVGISLSNARAAISGFRGTPSEFVRTPKFGVAEAEDQRWRRRQAYRKKQTGARVQSYIEVGMGLYMLACTVLCLETHWVTIGLPFLVLFTIGYLYVGLSSLLADRVWASAKTAVPAEERSTVSVSVPLAGEQTRGHAP